MSKVNLKVRMATLEKKPYRVADFPWKIYLAKKDNPDTFRKGVAYYYKSDLTEVLLPYRGVIDEFDPNEMKVGIYYFKKNGRYIMKIIFPRNLDEKKEYSADKAEDIVAATLNNQYTSDDFSDDTFNATDIGSGPFMPPIHDDDDMLNLALKMAIRTKGAPFEPYGKRIEMLAVDKTSGTSKSNTKGNLKRGFQMNRAMSPKKAKEVADAWQINMAIVMKDMPGAMHKMEGLEKDQVYVYYPLGIPFDINNDKMVNISEMVTKALEETSEEDNKTRSQKKEDSDDEW